MLQFVFYAFLFCKQINMYAKEIHVNPYAGDNMNPATYELPVKTISQALEISKTNIDSVNTIFLHPGLYQLKDAATIETGNSSKIIVQAFYMPNDTDWEISKMPVIQSVSKNNATFSFPHAVGFQISASHVIIKGIKFLGNPNPNVEYYYPINRDDFSSDDLTVSQCVFVGEPNSARIQGGVYVLGEGLQVENCIFYNCRNGILRFTVDEKSEKKCKNSIKNTVIYGAYESAIWSYTKSSFEFKNNIVANCNYFWVKALKDDNKYCFSNCVFSNNKHRIVSQQEDEFVEVKDVNLQEKNVIQVLDVRLKINTEANIQNDNLNLDKDSDVYNINAGIFK